MNIPSALPKIPAVPPSHETVIDLLITMAPNLPESIQLISPKASVTPYAWSNVAHGAKRVHGLPSEAPLAPETQVRDAAWVGAVIDSVSAMAAATRMRSVVPCFMTVAPEERFPRGCC